MTGYTEKGEKGFQQKRKIYKLFEKLKFENIKKKIKNFNFNLSKKKKRQKRLKETINILKKLNKRCDDQYRYLKKRKIDIILFKREMLKEFKKEIREIKYKEVQKIKLYTKKHIRTILFQEIQNNDFLCNKYNDVILFIPQNEIETVFLFAIMAKDLGFKILNVQYPFPDCQAIYKGTKINIEFEYVSINFKIHGHELSQCDLIICWENNWKDCPLPVLTLKDINIENKDRNILNENKFDAWLDNLIIK